MAKKLKDYTGAISDKEIRKFEFKGAISDDKLKSLKDSLQSEKFKTFKGTISDKELEFLKGLTK
tara:strand:+ start:731 stop:922 length:192 start_codon:yes stop_codon:yes gene_type:complete